jgi:hypothetical protein
MDSAPKIPRLAYPSPASIALPPLTVRKLKLCLGANILLTGNLPSCATAHFSPYRQASSGSA